MSDDPLTMTHLEPSSVFSFRPVRPFLAGDRPAVVGADVAPSADPIQHSGRHVGRIPPPAPPRRKARKGPHANLAAVPAPAPFAFAIGDAVGPVDATAVREAIVDGSADAWIRATAARFVGTVRTSATEYAPVPKTCRPDPYGELPSYVASRCWQLAVAAPWIADPLAMVRGVARNAKRQHARAGGIVEGRPSSRRTRAAEEAACRTVAGLQARAARAARRELLDELRAAQTAPLPEPTGPTVEARLRRMQRQRVALAAALAVALGQ